MEHIQLTPENVAVCAAKAAEVLRAGGVVLYPTDTLYGLGADAFSNTAVDMIYQIKGRDEGKPIHAIVSDLDMAGQFGEVGDEASALVQKFGGKLTVVVKKRPELNTGIARDIATFGFRVPDNEFCIALAKAFGRPITATSANKSGEKPVRSVEKILAQFGSGASRIDLVIDAGELPEREPSSVVDFSTGEQTILREGSISAASLGPLLARGTTRR